MKNYRTIHIWDFPANYTFVRVKESFRRQLIEKAINKFGNEPKLVAYISNRSTFYKIKRDLSRGMFYNWAKGYRISKGNNITANMPLWVVIEISRILSDSNSLNNENMVELERNIEYYCSSGPASRVYNPKLPILVTPELISLVFHFFGDGHMSTRPQVMSSYRQMNKIGLDNFHNKLKNCFGSFKISKGQMKDGKLHVPKIITETLKKYFNIDKSNWHDARIPDSIKGMSKNHLLAGLTAFIIDEGNVAEIIEIYSKNYNLLNDIRKVALKCGYDCKDIRKKFRYGVFDSYRFLISSNSYLRLNNDILELEREFPLCGLAHKTKRFNIMVKRKRRNFRTEKEGVTKRKILALLKEKTRTISEFVEILNIGNSSVREHLWRLEKDNKIIRKGTNGRNIIWSIK
jgi:hypothetical protein|tara:strand:- start:4418 stop:5626 length:1209 start_codon:yes stop_codon:yes gene_type:complete